MHACERICCLSHGRMCVLTGCFYAALCSSRDKFSKKHSEFRPSLKMRCELFQHGVLTASELQDAIENQYAIGRIMEGKNDEQYRKFLAILQNHTDHYQIPSSDTSDFMTPDPTGTYPEVRTRTTLEYWPRVCTLSLLLGAQ